VHLSLPLPSLSHCPCPSFNPHLHLSFPRSLARTVYQLHPHNHHPTRGRGGAEGDWRGRHTDIMVVSQAELDEDDWKAHGAAEVRPPAPLPGVRRASQAVLGLDEGAEAGFSGELIGAAQL
jgi:hypothetical protein